MLASLIFAAEKSHAAFYVCGGLLAIYAVVISFVGMRGADKDWPGNATVARGVMGLSTLLVVLAMATAVITAG